MIFEKVWETYFALRNDTINIFWLDMWNAIFFTTQAVWVEIIAISYLDEYYPNWRDDMKDNINTFLCID